MIAPSTASAAGGSRDDAIKLLDRTRVSVDETLALIESGDGVRALAEARSGYLAHFEQVEIPLRIADNDLTITAENQFATIRTAISDGKPVERDPRSRSSCSAACSTTPSAS